MDMLSFYHDELECFESLKLMPKGGLGPATTYCCPLSQHVTPSITMNDCESTFLYK